MFLKSYHSLNQAIEILYTLSHFILRRSLWDKQYHQPYVSDEETEAQEGKAIQQKSYRQ